MDQEDLVGIDIPGTPGDDEEGGSGMDIAAEAATSASSPGATRQRETHAGVEPEEGDEEPGSLTGEEDPVRRRAGPLTAEKASYNRARPGKRERAQLREQEQRKGSKSKGKGPKGKPKGRGKAKGKTDYWRGWSWWQDYEDDWRGRPWHREAPEQLEAPGEETRQEDQIEPGANQALPEAKGVKEEIPEEHPTPSLEVDWSEPITIRAVATSKRYPSLVMRLPAVEVKETSGRLSTRACPMVGTGKAPSKEPRFVIVAPTDHKKAWKFGSAKAHGLEPCFAFHASFLPHHRLSRGCATVKIKPTEREEAVPHSMDWSRSSSATGEMTQRSHGRPLLGQWECPDSRKSGICQLTISAEGGSKAATSGKS